jgi:hypothetical protein
MLDVDYYVIPDYSNSCEFGYVHVGSNKQVKVIHSMQDSASYLEKDCKINLLELMGIDVDDILMQKLIEKNLLYQIFSGMKFIRIDVDDCMDEYMLTAKKGIIDTCGNGICETWEDEETCPDDCKIIDKKRSWWWLYILLIALAIVLIAGYEQYKKRKIAYARKFIDEEFFDSDVDKELMARKLVKLGWPKISPMMINNVHNEFVRAHEQLRDYIDKELAKGISIDVLKKALIRVGWRKELVDKELSY